MKLRTSITISKDLLKTIDKLPLRPPRSEVIEEALRFYFKMAASKARDTKDREILDSLHEVLNDEASDVLSYQKK